MGDQDAVQVVLPEAEFEQEVEERLGRANGNIYHRRPGIEGLHDGQIMVRLKKKRYIIIDYGIIPNEADMQAAVLDTHIIFLMGLAGNSVPHQIVPKWASLFSFMIPIQERPSPSILEQDCALPVSAISMRSAVVNENESVTLLPRRIRILLSATPWRKRSSRLAVT